MSEKTPLEHIKLIKEHLEYLSSIDTGNYFTLERVKGYWRERLSHYQKQQLKLEQKQQQDERIF